MSIKEKLFNALDFRLDDIKNEIDCCRVYKTEEKLQEECKQCEFYESICKPAFEERDEE